METVTFKSVVESGARRSGISNPGGTGASAAGATLGGERFADLADYANSALETAWFFYFWPDLVRTELRQYRATYSAGTAYVATNEVWHPGAQKYAQALRATTGHAPFTLNATTRLWEVSAAYWAECAASYGSTDWTGPGTAYAVADVVRNPDDNLQYACHTAHTSAGAFDATKFGVLTAFNRYVAYEQSGQTALGTIKQVTRRDPRVFPTNPWRVSFTKSELGLQVGADAPEQVWVQYRLRAPIVNGNRYSAQTAYAAGDVVYYAATGECYRALQATTGNLPTVAAYWARVEFPRFLAEAVKAAIQAYAFGDQKQTSRANTILGRALLELVDSVERDKEEQMQSERAVYRR